MIGTRYLYPYQLKNRGEYMTKKERETREYISVYADERYAKKAWKQVIGSSLESAAKPLPTSYDPKTGEPTFQSQLDAMAYNNVKERLRAQGLEREPQQAELIVESHILRARFTDTSFNTILERTAGKVKDEITVNKSVFEDLTDEELALLAAHREKETEE